MQFDKLLKEANTDTQKRLVRHLVDNPGSSVADAARASGISRGHANKTISRLKERVARTTPAEHVPEKQGGAMDIPGYLLAGVSSLVDATGAVKQTWIKTKRDNQVDPLALLDAFTEAVELRELASVAPSTAPPVEVSAEELLAVFPLGDPHLGLVAWAQESGADYDTDQCAAHLRAGIEQLCGLMPQASAAVLINLGDLFHSDNRAGVTARSGHSLDVDPRWTRVAVIAVDTMCHMIDTLLTKYPTVVVDNRIGNHDDHSSWMLSLCLAARYKEEPRVDIVCDPSMFWCYEFGKVLIASTHGHSCKADRLPGVMATDWPEAWGRTTHRQWYVGHIHHKDLREKEYSGCSVESFRTLAAKDAWGAGAGLRAQRSICADIWHRETGHKLRHIVGIESLTAA